MTSKTASLPLSQVVAALEELLQQENYQDSSWNGIQVESGQPEISKIGLAVDAGESVINEAVAAGCDLLITHHGLFWGKCSPVLTGPLGRKVRSLIQGGCSLFTSHLPLDGNALVGNAFEVARALKIQTIEPAFEYGGSTIGAVGVLQSPMPVENFVDFAFAAIIPEGQPYSKHNLLFGSKTVQSVGVATGSASELIPEARQIGCDVLISGEPKQEAYHAAKEHGMNAVFAGHYHTETFGVKALGKFIEKELEISCKFIDEPTSI